MKPLTGNIYDGSHEALFERIVVPRCDRQADQTDEDGALVAGQEGRQPEDVEPGK